MIDVASQLGRETNDGLEKGTEHKKMRPLASFI